MSIVWLVVLLIHGFYTGWQIPPLAWLLLIPFFYQDIYDVGRKCK